MKRLTYAMRKMCQFLSVIIAFSHVSFATANVIKVGEHLGSEGEHLGSTVVKKGKKLVGLDGDHSSPSNAGAGTQVSGQCTDGKMKGKKLCDSKKCPSPGGCYGVVCPYEVYQKCKLHPPLATQTKVCKTFYSELNKLGTDKCTGCLDIADKLASMTNSIQNASDYYNGTFTNWFTGQGSDNVYYLLNKVDNLAQAIALNQKLLSQADAKAKEYQAYLTNRFKQDSRSALMGQIAYIGSIAGAIEGEGVPPKLSQVLTWANTPPNNNVVIYNEAATLCQLTTDATIVKKAVCGPGTKAYTDWGQYAEEQYNALPADQQGWVDTLVAKFKSATYPDFTEEAPELVQHMETLQAQLEQLEANGTLFQPTTSPVTPENFPPQTTVNQVYTAANNCQNNICYGQLALMGLLYDILTLYTGYKNGQWVPRGSFYAPLNEGMGLLNKLEEGGDLNLGMACFQNSSGDYIDQSLYFYDGNDSYLGRLPGWALPVDLSDPTSWGSYQKKWCDKAYDAMSSWLTDHYPKKQAVQKSIEDQQTALAKLIQNNGATIQSAAATSIQNVAQLMKQAADLVTSVASTKIQKSLCSDAEKQQGVDPKTCVSNALAPQCKTAAECQQLAGGAGTLTLHTKYNSASYDEDKHGNYVCAKEDQDDTSPCFYIKKTDAHSLAVQVKDAKGNEVFSSYPLPPGSEKLVIYYTRSTVPDPAGDIIVPYVPNFIQTPVGADYVTAANNGYLAAYLNLVGQGGELQAQVEAMKEHKQNCCFGIIDLDSMCQPDSLPSEGWSSLLQPQSLVSLGMGVVFILPMLGEMVKGIGGKVSKLVSKKTIEDMEKDYNDSKANLERSRAIENSRRERWAEKHPDQMKKVKEIEQNQRELKETKNAAKEKRKAAEENRKNAEENRKAAKEKRKAAEEKRKAAENEKNEAKRNALEEDASKLDRQADSLEAKADQLDTKAQGLDAGAKSLENKAGRLEKTIETDTDTLSPQGKIELRIREKYNKIDGNKEGVLKAKGKEIEKKGGDPVEPPKVEPPSTTSDPSESGPPGGTEPGGPGSPSPDSGPPGGSKVMSDPPPGAGSPTEILTFDDANMTLKSLSSDLTTALGDDAAATIKTALENAGVEPGDVAAIEIEGKTYSVMEEEDGTIREVTGDGVEDLGSSEEGPPIDLTPTA